LAPELLASPTFLTAYENLHRIDRLAQALDKCIDLLLSNPVHPGLHTEKLDSSGSWNISFAA
jgi:hypothetical protein